MLNLSMPDGLELFDTNPDRARGLSGRKGVMGIFSFKTQHNSGTCSQPDSHLLYLTTGNVFDLKINTFQTFIEI